MSSNEADASRRLVRSMLDAVERRDADAAAEHFAVDGSWQNVPHPAAVGRPAIADMLRRILERSSEVRWDVVTESYTDDRAWLERVDRFWIDGNALAVPCNGVLDINPETNLITELRDYVDLGEWRKQLASIEL